MYNLGYRYRELLSENLFIFPVKQGCFVWSLLVQMYRDALLSSYFQVLIFFHERSSNGINRGSFSFSFVETFETCNGRDG